MIKQGRAGGAILTKQKFQRLFPAVIAAISILLGYFYGMHNNPALRQPKASDTSPKIEVSTVSQWPSEINDYIVYCSGFTHDIDGNRVEPDINAHFNVEESLLQPIVALGMEANSKLYACLGSDNPYVRQMAVAALFRINGKDAIDVVLIASRDKFLVVRSQIYIEHSKLYPNNKLYAEDQFLRAHIENTFFDGVLDWYIKNINVEAQN